MRLRSHILLPVSGLALALMLSGCGGSGGGSDSNGTNSGGATAQVALFATDSFRDDYAHVWTTITQVELLKADGTATTTFSSTTGTTIDLKTLRDASGARFCFLATAKAPAGTYTGVRVTIAPSLTLFATGSTVGVATPVAASVPKNAAGDAQISLSFATPYTVGTGSGAVVIDFDLANFTISGGTVVPVLKEGGQQGLNDPKRHEREDYDGALSGLSGTAPNVTFALQDDHNGAITVTTDSTTSLANASGAANPTLASGQNVAVWGAYNVTTKTLAAALITIRDVAAPSHPADVLGAPTNLNATAGTFTVSALKTRGFTPTQTTVTVVLGGAASLHSDSGVTLSPADFFTALATATNVEATGSYDAASNTLTARQARLASGLEGDKPGNGSGPGHDSLANAQGRVSASSATAGTLTLSPIAEFEGFALVGASLPVVTTPTTTYRGANGASLTAAAFFAALTATSKVDVRGTYATGTLTAQMIKVGG